MSKAKEKKDYMKETLKIYIITNNYKKYYNRGSLEHATVRLKFSTITFGLRYLRMDQVKFAEAIL